MPYNIRADMFHSLATMEDAGLPFQKALELIKLPKKLQPRLTQTIKFITRGENLAIAGKKSGLFSAWESRLLQAALTAGSPASTYRNLARTYQIKAMQAKKLKARLMLPLFIFALALFIQPLPGLIKGSISIATYLAQCLIPLLSLGSLVFFPAYLAKWLEPGGLKEKYNLIELLLLRIPLIGAIHEKRCNTDFLESLGLLLEAGVPMLDALPIVLNTIRNSIVKDNFAGIVPKVVNGATLAQALKAISSFKNPQAIDFIETGEASGTLPEMLFRYVNGQHESINHLQQQLVDWLPRIIYTAVVCYLAYGLLQGNGFATAIPAKLQ
jgi:general secretion pathway protein F